MPTPEPGVPYTTGGVDDMTQAVIDDIEEAAQSGTTALARRLVLKQPRTRGIAPAGRKLRGSNIVPKAAHAGSFGAMFEEWDWAGWVKPQVDALASVGGNVVRLIGHFPMATAGMTEAEYLAHWGELADYCETVGMMLYPCMGGSSQVASAVEPLADLAGRWVAYLDVKPSVVAFDLMNEINQWPSSDPTVTLDEAEAEAVLFLAAARAATTLPVTVSLSSGIATSAVIARWEEHCDFFDFHLYTSETLDSSTVNTYHSLTGLPLVIGEFGSPLSAGATAQALRYRVVRQLVSERPGIVGSLTWGITDQDTVDSNKWGMFDATFAARSYLTNIFQTLSASVDHPWTVIVKPTANTTINVGAAATKALTGASGTFQFPVGCMVDIETIGDIDVKVSGNQYQVYPLVDGTASSIEGEAGTSDFAKAFFGGDVVARATVAIRHRAYLAPGQHTIAIEAAHAAGADLTGVMYASTTRAVCTFHPVA